MVRSTWRRHFVPVATLVFVMIAGAVIGQTVEVTTSAISAQASHMEHGVQERPDSARNHHASLHGGAPDCIGGGAICPMMGLCHPAMLVDLSLMADVVHDDHMVAISVGRGKGINPSIVLPPPRQLHL